jgi:hypothetical protein
MENTLACNAGKKRMTGPLVLIPRHVYAEIAVTQIQAGQKNKMWGKNSFRSGYALHSKHKSKHPLWVIYLSSKTIRSRLS